MNGYDIIKNANYIAADFMTEIHQHFRFDNGDGLNQPLMALTTIDWSVLYPDFYLIRPSIFPLTSGSNQAEIALNNPSAPIQNTATRVSLLDELMLNESVPEFPESFQCSITSQIMTDPVYDPSHPQYKFERVVIEEILRKKAENPYTRTPLRIIDLVSDVILKQDIEQYITEIISNNSPRPI